MQLISKFNKGFRFSLCVIDIYSKYSWVIPWVIPKFDDTKFLNVVILLKHQNIKIFLRNFILQIGLKKFL